MLVYAPICFTVLLLGTAFEADVVKIWGKESNLKRRGGGKNQSSLKNIHPCKFSLAVACTNIFSLSKSWHDLLCLWNNAPWQEKLSNFCCTHEQIKLVKDTCQGKRAPLYGTRY